MTESAGPGSKCVPRPRVTPFLLGGKGAPHPRAHPADRGPTHRRRAFWFGHRGFMVRSLLGDVFSLSGGCSCGQILQVVRRGDHDAALLRQVRGAHAADRRQTSDRNGGRGLEETCPRTPGILRLLRQELCGLEIHSGGAGGDYHTQHCSVSPLAV